MQLYQRISLVAVTAVTGMLFGSAAQAATHWGGLHDYYGGNLVASASGYYSETSTQEIQTSSYQDRRADGHGAYTRANFQPFWHQCYPDPATCRWEWGDVTVKKTPELASADGVKVASVSTKRNWPTNRDWADLCIDISLRPDPCVSSPNLYP